MPSGLGGGVGLLLIRSWVLGNEAHENRNGVLLFFIMCVKKLWHVYIYRKEDY